MEPEPEPDKGPPAAFPELDDKAQDYTPAEPEDQVQAPPLEWLVLAAPRQGAAATHLETDASPEPMPPPAPLLPGPRGVQLANDLPAARVPEPVAVAPPAPAPAKPATPPPPSRHGLPAWMVSGVVATALLLVGWAVVYQYASARSTDHAAAANPPEPVAQQREKPAPTAPTQVSYELARSVEVTGLRVVADLKNRSAVHYIVVNHSATPLPGLMVRLTVWSSAAAAGGQPLFTLSSSVPSLAPYGSTEIQGDIPNLRAAAIPDWENLKPEVQISAQ